MTITEQDELLVKALKKWVRQYVVGAAGPPGPKGDPGVCTCDPDDPAPPPLPSVSPPLSFDDARFAGNVDSPAVRLSIGQSLAGKTITTLHNNTASIVCDGDNVVTGCRVNSREGVRIGGPGLFTFDGCWFEARGSSQEQDHADTIQAYSPGDKGILTVRNSTVRAYDEAATAGIFVADDWTGTVVLENCVIWGGPYGTRLHSDVGGDLHVDFKDVFYVGPFSGAPFLIGPWRGTKIIVDRWENVCEATIVDGVLVPGLPLTSP